MDVKDIVDIVFSYLSFKDQIQFLLVNKMCASCEITDLYHIPTKCQRKLTDEILRRYPHVTMLDASGNTMITDYGIRHMMHTLRVLDASWNDEITDYGIRHIPLHTLYTSFNTMITDDGIRDMPLRVLDASFNTMITNDGIRGMMLHTLNASDNEMITDDGIRHMLGTLRVLYSFGNDNISIVI